jgi:hypothetical protein
MTYTPSKEPKPVTSGLEEGLQRICCWRELTGMMAKSILEMIAWHNSLVDDPKRRDLL